MTETNFRLLNFRASFGLTQGKKAGQTYSLFGWEDPHGSFEILTKFQQRLCSFMFPECFFAFDSNSFALEQLDLMREKNCLNKKLEGTREPKQIYCRDILVVRILEPWGNGFLFKIKGLSL